MKGYINVLLDWAGRPKSEAAVDNDRWVYRSAAKSAKSKVTTLDVRDSTRRKKSLAA